MLFYDDAWRKVRVKRKYRSLEDGLLWHKVYEEYINSLPLAELGASRDELIERHLRIVGPIAGQMAWRRTPHSFGIWAKECQSNMSHVGLVYELKAMVDYLQRRVSFNLYPWLDMGTHSTPRFALPGHTGGRASAVPPRDYNYKFDAADEIELRAPPIGDTGPSMAYNGIYRGDNGPKMEASLQTYVNPNGGKTWRKPTIRIHTYPKVMAMAAE